MNRNVDLLYGSYSHFDADALARVRRKTYGEDLGQNSWTTAEEYRDWVEWLGLDAASHVLEVASGSGGPALFLAQTCGCHLTGIDINPHGVAAATRTAQAYGVAGRVTFLEADMDTALPFPEGTFDAVICIDSANHFAPRAEVLKEWHRVLKPGGKVLFTDPVVVTGLVSNEELAIRSSIGYFVFAPPGVNERLLGAAGFELLRCEDVTASEAAVSQRWHDAREEERDALVRIEGEERYLGLQRFFAIVHRLTHERRLSRFAYLARKPAAG